MGTTLPKPMSSATNAHPKIPIIGGGGVGTIVAYSLELTGRVVVSIVLRSKLKVVPRNAFNIKSWDHGKIQGWIPSAGIRSEIPAHDSSTPETAFDYIVCRTKNISDVLPISLLPTLR